MHENPEIPNKPRGSWRTLPGSEPREHYLTILPEPGEGALSALESLKQALASPSRDLQVLELRVFASRDQFPSLLTGLREMAIGHKWPVSLLDGTPEWGSGVAGLQLHLLEGATADPLTLEDRTVGTAFTRGGIRFCVLGSVAPRDLTQSPRGQALETLRIMEELLDGQGMSLKDLVRTWFFMDEILAWYPAFNEVRTSLFRDRGIFQGYVPASTGIGGANHLGAAVMASAVAAGPGPEGRGVRALPSPLQCPAGSYGSNFSRAAEFLGRECRRVLVSGTASIDPNGATAHKGSVEAQIRLTFEVVEAILAEQGLGFGDVVRGNAYFQDVTHASALEPALARHGLPGEVLVTSQNTVCRPDLLFEMEVEAAVPR